MDTGQLATLGTLTTRTLSLGLGFSLGLGLSLVLGFSLGLGLSLGLGFSLGLGLCFSLGSGAPLDLAYFEAVNAKGSVESELVSKILPNPYGWTK